MIVNFLLVFVLLQCGTILTQNATKSSTSPNTVLQQLRDSLDHYNASKLTSSFCSNCSVSWEQRSLANSFLVDRFSRFLNEIQNVTKNGADLQPIFSNFTNATKSVLPWPSLTLNVWGNSSASADDRLTSQSADMVVEAFLEFLLPNTSDNKDRHTMGPYYAGYEKKLCVCQADYVVEAAITDVATGRYRILQKIDEYYNSSTARDKFISAEFDCEGNGTTIRLYFTKELNESTMTNTGRDILSSVGVSISSIRVSPVTNASVATTTKSLVQNTSTTTSGTRLSTLISTVTSRPSISTSATTNASGISFRTTVNNTSSRTSTRGTQSVTYVSTPGTSLTNTDLSTNQNTLSANATIISSTGLSANSTTISSTGYGTATNSPSIPFILFNTTSGRGSSSETTSSATTTYTKISVNGVNGTTRSSTVSTRITSTTSATRLDHTETRTGTAGLSSSNFANGVTPKISDVTTDAAVKLADKIDAIDFTKYQLLYVTLPSFAGILIIILGCWFCLHCSP